MKFRQTFPGSGDYKSDALHSSGNPAFKISSAHGVWEVSAYADDAVVVAGRKNSAGYGLLATRTTFRECKAFVESHRHDL